MITSFWGDYSIQDREQATHDGIADLMEEAMKAEITEIIRVECTVGTGTKEDPMRTEVGYFSKDGKPIAIMDINDDPCSPLRQS